jgi:hypothetical protein
MICLLILTAHDRALELEIREDQSGDYASLAGTPRGLLPSGVKDKRISDIWWDAVSKRHIFEKGARTAPAAAAPPPRRASTAPGRCLTSSRCRLAQCT